MTTLSPPRCYSRCFHCTVGVRFSFFLLIPFLEESRRLESAGWLIMPLVHPARILTQAFARNCICNQAHALYLEGGSFREVCKPTAIPASGSRVTALILQKQVDRFMFWWFSCHPACLDETMEPDPMTDVLDSNLSP